MPTNKRAVEKRRQRSRQCVADAGGCIQRGVCVGDTVRKFNYALRKVLKEQLALLYADLLTGPVINSQQARVKLDEFHEEFYQSLYRLAHGMRRLAREQKERNRSTPLMQRSLEVLQLEPHRAYTLEEVRAQYLQLAKQVHPDHNGNNDETTARMQDLNEAYAYLKERL